MSDLVYVVRGVNSNDSDVLGVFDEYEKVIEYVRFAKKSFQFIYSAIVFNKYNMNEGDEA